MVTFLKMFFLFSDTIANNISFGVSDTELDIVRTYADHAAIGEDIEDFRDGYETMVGERGVMLSGGQKQRISIARALIKQPELIILDDCLSAVDARTEKRIVDFLEDELADKTTLMITHRIPHGMSFDKILTLENGRLVEFGSHEELESSGGYYSRLLVDNMTEGKVKE